MPVWVNCASPSPAYFGGWAADMGEYTGPWPMMPPPLVTNGDPTMNDEVDFVLGLPNPAHPGDPYYALDDSYHSPIWNNWRRLTSDAPGSQVGYQRSYSGDDNSYLPGPTDVPPSGVHLWVVAYFAAGEPANPPESYVPRTYAAGGTCLYETVRGALSGWQSGIPHSVPVDHVSFDYSQFLQTHESEVSGVGGEAPDPWESLHDLVQAQMDAVSATTWDYDSATFAQFTDFSFTHAGLSRYWGKAWSFFDFHHRDAHFGVCPLVLQYDATPTQDFPGPLFSMTPGVDYAPIPWADEPYEYEAPEPASFAWDDLNARIQIDVNNLYGSALDHTPYTARVRFSTLTDYPAAPVTGPITGGDTLLEVALDETTDTVSDHALDLSGVGTRLILNVAMTFWEDGLIGDLAPDLPDPLLDGTGGEYDFSYHCQVDRPSYSWVTSRWRYELPDLVVPLMAWHNFTGHYRNFTGATHYIFTPGLGPVPMADGLP